MLISGCSAVTSPLPCRPRVKNIGIRRAAGGAALLALLGANQAVPCAAQQIYEQIDEQGRVTFTNVPSSAHIKPHVPAGPMMSRDGVPAPQPVETDSPPPADDANAAAPADDDAASASPQVIPGNNAVYTRDPESGAVHKALRRAPSEAQRGQPGPASPGSP
jgi:hypothetical protein